MGFKPESEAPKPDELFNPLKSPSNNLSLPKGPDGKFLPADDETSEEAKRLKGETLVDKSAKPIEEIPSQEPNPEEILINKEEEKEVELEKLEESAETIKTLNENEKKEILGGMTTPKDGYGAQGWQTTDGGYPPAEQKPGILATIKNWLRPGGDKKVEIEETEEAKPEEPKNPEAQL